MQSFEEKALELMHEEFKRSGAVRPKVTVLTNIGQVLYFDYNGSDEDMAKARESIKLTIRLTRISGRFMCACFSSEAWISHRTKENLMPKLRACEDPNKREGVFCITWEGDKRAVNLFDIKRTEGKAELVKQENPYDDFEMWLDDAFDPLFKTAVPDEIKWAAAMTLDKMFPCRNAPR
jgi:hypothetical protein